MQCCNNIMNDISFLNEKKVINKPLANRNVSLLDHIVHQVKTKPSSCSISMKAGMLDLTTKNITKSSIDTLVTIFGYHQLTNTLQLIPVLHIFV